MKKPGDSISRRAGSFVGQDCNLPVNYVLAGQVANLPHDGHQIFFGIRMA